MNDSTLKLSRPIFPSHPALWLWKLARPYLFAVIAAPLGYIIISLVLDWPTIDHVTYVYILAWGGPILSAGCLAYEFGRRQTSVSSARRHDLSHVWRYTFMIMIVMTILVGLMGNMALAIPVVDLSLLVGLVGTLLVLTRSSRTN